MKITPYLLALVAACAVGCANTSQKFTSPVFLGTTNGYPIVGSRTMENHLATGFQSSQVLEKVRLRNGQWNGDIMTFGVDSVAQSADATKFADTVSALLVKGLMAYMTGGASALVPTPGATTTTTTTPATTTVLPGIKTFTLADGTILPMPDHVVRNSDGSVTVCWDKEGKICYYISTNSVLLK